VITLSQEDFKVLDDHFESMKDNPSVEGFSGRFSNGVKYSYDSLKGEFKLYYRFSRKKIKLVWKAALIKWGEFKEWIKSLFRKEEGVVA
jgi:hypothetical protein